jgi:hypothetical protein
MRHFLHIKIAQFVILNLLHKVIVQYLLKVDLQGDLKDEKFHQKEGH